MRAPRTLIRAATVTTATTAAAVALTLTALTGSAQAAPAAPADAGLPKALSGLGETLSSLLGGDPAQKTAPPAPADASPVQASVSTKGVRVNFWQGISVTDDSGHTLTDRRSAPAHAAPPFAAAKPRPRPRPTGLLGTGIGAPQGLLGTKLLGEKLLGGEPGDRTSHGLLGTGIGAPQGLLGTKLLGESLVSGTPGGVI